MAALQKNELDEIFNKLDLSPNEFTTFIETGSFFGDTINNMITYFKKLITIEVSHKYHTIVSERFKEADNVECILGDSGLILLDVIKNYKTGNVFWLDGHFSSGDTGKGVLDCPLIEELKSIDSFCDNSIIIIDDYRMFGTNTDQDWLEITDENVISCFVKNPIKKIFNFNDKLIICI